MKVAGLDASLDFYLGVGLKQKNVELFRQLSCLQKHIFSLIPSYKIIIMLLMKGTPWFLGHGTLLNANLKY